MKNLFKILFYTITFILLVGCNANWNAIHYKNTLNDGSHFIYTDAKQKALISVVKETSENNGTKRTKLRRVCSEPSPDVFSVISQAFSIEGTFGKNADPKTLETALKSTFSNSETGSTIARTQTINMLKEMMYRTCERVMNGAIDDVEASIVAARDQRIMVSILAIDQLTSAISKRHDSNSTDTKDNEQIRSETIKHVSNTIESIVDKSFRQNDETSFFCYKMIQKNINSKLTDSCVNFLTTKINKQIGEDNSEKILQDAKDRAKKIEQDAKDKAKEIEEELENKAKFLKSLKENNNLFFKNINPILLHQYHFEDFWDKFGNKVTNKVDKNLLETYLKSHKDSLHSKSKKELEELKNAKSREDAETIFYTLSIESKKFLKGEFTCPAPDELLRQ